MNTFYLALPIFFVIAFVFSMLGMGSSQLYIPIIFWRDMDLKTEAVPLGMLLNAVNSSSAAITYTRSKLIVWRVAFPFAIAMIAFAPPCVCLNVQLPAKPLLYIGGLQVRNAATTSALVVTCSGLSSFISHLATAAQPQWGVWIGTVAAVLLGSQIGSWLMASRMKSRAVKQVFGWVLLGMAALIFVKDVILA
ncbi:MAG: sulfite exporter TauE/SafE family protein [Anaerolineae bacterium]